MRLAVGSDERSSLTDAVVAGLRVRGYELELYGHLTETPLSWSAVGRQVGLRVSEGACDQGLLFCWTGTGVSIAANKVPGVRAALSWSAVGRQVGLRVSEGACDQGLLFCWTGTGVSIAANKVPGVRAALCNDAETARGARAWNDANVLCLSLRTLSEPVAQEILDAWFSTAAEQSEQENIAVLAQIEDAAQATSPPQAR